MTPLDAAERSVLRPWLLPDRPGPLVGLHVLQSGRGECWADRLPDPRGVVFFTGGNLAFAGDAEALCARDLRARVAHWLETWERVLIEAHGPFERLVARTIDPLQRWDRVIYALKGAAAEPGTPRDVTLRRLGAQDTDALRSLEPDLHWIWDPWDDPEGLAGSGGVWGAFQGGTLASVAAPFFVGDRYEDIAVVTREAQRGLGLSTLCAHRVCTDIRARGRTPSWSTSPDNTGSRRVAEKLGFEHVRDDFLLVAGEPINP